MINFFYSVCQCGEEFGSYTAILFPAKGRHFELMVITFIEMPRLVQQTIVLQPSEVCPFSANKSKNKRDSELIFMNPLLAQ